MDKLLEFLANFFLLVFGLMAVLQAGIISTNGSQAIRESDSAGGACWHGRPSISY